MNVAVVPSVPPPRSPAPASCPGLQSRQLYAEPGVAEGGGALVADHHQGEVGQDRRRGHRSWPLRHVPDGRSCRTPRSVPGHPAADRSTATTYPYNGLNGRKKRGGSAEGVGTEHTSELQSLMRT